MSPSPRPTHPNSSERSSLSSNSAFRVANNGATSKLPSGIRKQFIECYNLLDVDHTCSIGIDVLQGFAANFPHEPTSEEVLELYKEIDREHTGCIDPNGFLWIVERLLSSGQTNPEEVIHNFHRSNCIELFHLMGDRITIGDFNDIIEHISSAYAIPFDELFTGVRATWEERRGGTRAGGHEPTESFSASASSHALKRHSSTRQLRGPPQQIVSSMEQLIKEMSSESQEYQVTIHKLQKDLADANEEMEKVKASLKEAQDALAAQQVHTEELLREFEDKEREKDETIDRLLSRIDLLQEELEDEMEKEPENIIEEIANTYLLVLPGNLSERTETLLIERPGALYYQLDPPRKPMKLTMDVCTRIHPNGTKQGKEYIVCRDSNGGRVLSASISECVLSVGMHTETYYLPEEKWMRITFKFYWEKNRIDCSINDHGIWGIPFRDANVRDIAHLDIYPREDVNVIYRNVRFLL